MVVCCVFNIIYLILLDLGSAFDEMCSVKRYIIYIEKTKYNYKLV